MEIIETQSPREEAGRALSEALLQHVKVPVLLMLSGGSAFTILDFVSRDVLGPQVTIIMLDERYSTDPKVNNFAQLEQTDFYKACMEQGVHCISTTVREGESMDALRNRFEAALHDWHEQHKNGVVIATMGIGVDGHVAGILPGEYKVDFNGSSWVVGYSVPRTVNPYLDRITVTYTFLREQIHEVIIFVDRNEKSEIIKELQNDNHQRNMQSSKPMNIIHQMRRVSLYTNFAS